MEITLDKRYPVDAGLEHAWTVLSDVRAVAACMPGAQITEQIDATHYKGTVRTRVGPATMNFGGEIEVLALDAATRSLEMLGKGADKAGSSASMKLAARVEAAEAGGGCVLAGTATMSVSGKLAQFGARLIVPVSDAMLAQFADNFRAAAAAAQAAAAAPAPHADEGTVGLQVMGGEAPGAVAGDTAPPVADAAPAAPVPPSPVPAPRPAPAPAKELNALGLLWTVFKNWLAGLFGRKRA